MVGVAKEASVVSVRVLDCNGTGPVSTTLAGEPLQVFIHCFTAGNSRRICVVPSHQILHAAGMSRHKCKYMFRYLDLIKKCESREHSLAGLNWVAENAAPPAIAQLCLGLPQSNWSAALNSAVSSLIDNYNVTVIVADGNSDTDSCTISPGEPSLSS